MTDQTTEALQAKIRDALFDHVTDKEGWSLPEHKALFTAETAIAVAMMFAHPPADQRLREVLKPFVAHWQPWMDATDATSDGSNNWPDSAEMSCFARVTFGDIRRARTALAASEDDGWVMVPREPTREMWAAGGNAVVGYKNRHHDKVVEQLWSAMIAAAPTSLDVSSIGDKA